LIKGANSMGETGPKSAPPKGRPAKNDSGGRNKPPPAPVENDEVEDGDIATPKHDRHGTDDEPL
jgi:hypothetical protein